MGKKIPPVFSQLHIQRSWKLYLYHTFPVNIQRICNHNSTWDLLSISQLTRLPSLFDLISNAIKPTWSPGPCAVWVCVGERQRENWRERVQLAVGPCGRQHYCVHICVCTCLLCVGQCVCLRWELSSGGNSSLTLILSLSVAKFCWPSGCLYLSTSVSEVLRFIVYGVCVCVLVCVRVRACVCVCMSACMPACVCSVGGMH